MRFDNNSVRNRLINISDRKRRILSISHQQDVDGLFCSAILKNTFPDTLVFLTNYGFNNILQISNIIDYNITKSTKNGTIIISDLALNNKREAEILLDSGIKAREKGWDMYWIDHHPWKEEIKETVKSFATLILSKEEDHKCAAELVYEYLPIKRTACERMAKFAHVIDFRLPEANKLPPLPEIIRYYQNLPNSFKKLQSIIERASRGIFWDDRLQEEYEKDYLPLKKTAIDYALNSLATCNISNHKIAITESPKIIPKSILAEIIFEKVKDVDLAVLFAPDGKISLRRRQGTSIRCDIIAIKLNGGGHSYAAAGVISKSKESRKGNADDVIDESNEKDKQNGITREDVVNALTAVLEKS